MLARPWSLKTPSRRCKHTKDSAGEIIAYTSESFLNWLMALESPSLLVVSAYRLGALVWACRLVWAYCLALSVSQLAPLVAYRLGQVVMLLAAPL